ncbi:TIGR00270 family protein [Candidatus Woesearchaeota archaeon]|jgi:uncharacterized protein (TIGR00270 family)|nr:TIGR00270 family protein [Candidatus Woesearchaeota archaeon]MBT4387315.1 TIGR00270 family protein [Candidatus Woesearchaeota archaeon]MBT4595454.1 TIGR00270 family protein [Candidatus Woesearchaeota archaeon]MBT5741169.1 TIGR00270 family protein [Candidatus Woesearchaeota archaeon]MBT7297064.1 TIGR00270 family protein [Candidatus Woesearchaeota archaeon]
MACDMCGKAGNFEEFRLEGANLKLCSNCNKGGTKIKKNFANLKSNSKGYNNNNNTNSYSNFVIRKSVVPNFSNLIRNKRNSLNLNIEEFASLVNEKATFIQKLESSKLTPSIEIAQKLQKTLKLKLLDEDGSDNEDNVFVSKNDDDSNDLTLGDFIKFR